MATVQTLPDILIVLFAHPNVSVADLLKCERVCQTWCAVIRTYQVEIWKSKVQAAYPDGCCPVLYGNEVWRDVAVLWWAWQRPWPSAVISELDGRGSTMAAAAKGREKKEKPTWQPPTGCTVGSAIELQDIRHPERLHRRSDGVVRDLITSCSFFGAADPALVAGARADGRVMLTGGYGDDYTFLDIVFSETLSTAPPPVDLARHFQFARANALVRHPDHKCEMYYRGHYNGLEPVFKDADTGNICYLLIEDWNTAELMAQIPRTYRYFFICGDYWIEGDHEDAQAHIYSILNTSQRHTISTQCKGSHRNAAINETLLAYVTYDQHAHTSECQLRLLRLADHQIIATYELEREPARMTITRFFVVLDYEEDCAVFDFSLNRMCTLPPIAKADDWMLFFYQPWADIPWARREDEYYHSWRRAPDAEPTELFVMDAKSRTCYPVFPKCLERKTGHCTNYYFNTIEYPVDKAGRRTGAGGVCKLPRAVADACTQTVADEAGKDSSVRDISSEEGSVGGGAVGSDASCEKYNFTIGVPWRGMRISWAIEFDSGASSGDWRRFEWLRWPAGVGGRVMRRLDGAWGAGGQVLERLRGAFDAGGRSDDRL
ncbi:hypothetical protein HDV00_003070 [Rhizophlyctis rosea]|nr:hypothetical protein HDV00_003070 [Rhizophlyctis rosea]